jgi:hypothetical protein
MARGTKGTDHYARELARRFGSPGFSVRLLPGATFAIYRGSERYTEEPKPTLRQAIMAACDRLKREETP